MESSKQLSQFILLLVMCAGALALGVIIGLFWSDNGDRENACRLYDNYSTAYVILDDFCNNDSSCKGTLAQETSQETFKDWKKWNDNNCN